ncbi:hypothetical protein F5050DRAFT_1712002 [Lentinula boryana]|uniref:Uncharacterized protein n=1 Tax=Lentinula boryana TaxID=40481 RepID=A0ABQ8QDE0_9AGAR|nr:hypothetical protein F5050DRAFT_1712002 [Lentinula boryana]
MTVHLLPSHLLVMVFLFSSLYTILAAPQQCKNDHDPATLELCNNPASGSWALKLSPTIFFQAVRDPMGQWKAQRGLYTQNSQTNCVDVGTVHWAAIRPNTKRASALLAIEATSEFDYVGKGLQYLLDSEVWEVNWDSWKQGDQDSYLRISDKYLKTGSISALGLCHYPGSESWALKLGVTAFHMVEDHPRGMKIMETQCNSQTKHIKLGTVPYGCLTPTQVKSQAHAEFLAIEATSEFDFICKGLQWLLSLNIWDPDWSSWMQGDQNSYSRFFRSYLANTMGHRTVLFRIILSLYFLIHVRADKAYSVLKYWGPEWFGNNQTSGRRVSGGCLLVAQHEGKGKKGQKPFSFQVYITSI